MRALGVWGAGARRLCRTCPPSESRASRSHRHRGPDRWRPRGLPPTCSTSCCILPRRRRSKIRSSSLTASRAPRTDILTRRITWHGQGIRDRGVRGRLRARCGSRFTETSATQRDSKRYFSAVGPVYHRGGSRRVLCRASIVCGPGITYAVRLAALDRTGIAMEKNMAPQQSISKPLEVRDQNVDLGSTNTAPNRSARSEQSSAVLSCAISPRWRNLSYRRYRPKLAVSLSTAAAFVLIGLVVAWVAPGLINSSEQRMLHRAAVHRDDSVVRTGVTANFKRPITLYYREVDGSLRLLLTDEGEINRFVNETLLFLDNERQKIKDHTLGRNRDTPCRRVWGPSSFDQPLCGLVLRVGSILGRPEGSIPWRLESDRAQQCPRDL